MQFEESAKQIEYLGTVQGWDGRDAWKDIDVRILVARGTGEPTPTVIFFSSKAAFSVGQLQQIVSDLKELESRESCN